MIINGVTVIADNSLSQEEIHAVVDQEIQLWQQKNKQLGTVELTVENENIVVKASEKSPIRRVRRITGYLSNFENFNDAKRNECLSRETHIS